MELVTEQQNKTILAAAIGNTLEWYDFAIYGYFAVIMGHLFFPGDDATLSLLASFAVFASGFLARPIRCYYFWTYWG